MVGWYFQLRTCQETELSENFAELYYFCFGRKAKFQCYFAFAIFPIPIKVNMMPYCARRAGERQANILLYSARKAGAQHAPN